MFGLSQYSIRSKLSVAKKSAYAFICAGKKGFIYVLNCDVILRTLLLLRAEQLVILY